MHRQFSICTALKKVDLKKFLFSWERLVFPLYIAPNHLSNSILKQIWHRKKYDHSFCVPLLNRPNTVEPCSRVVFFYSSKSWYGKKGPSANGKKRTKININTESSNGKNFPLVNGKFVFAFAGGNFFSFCQSRKRPLSHSFS